MNSEQITVEEIDELLGYLPRFEAPGRQFVVRWAGGEETSDGAITVPYPIYTDDVVAFFMRAGQPSWSDYGYDPAEACTMLADDAFIARATLDEIRTMLTYCVRGERFCDGHWEAVLTSGRVAALLRRLAALREQRRAPPADGTR